MKIKIEITKKERNGKWDMRVGDIEGCSESINLTKKELLDEIKDEVDKFDLELSIKKFDAVSKDKKGCGKRFDYDDDMPMTCGMFWNGEQMKIKDFPKIESPFKRKIDSIKKKKEQWVKA